MKILEFSQKVIKAICRVKLKIFGRAPNSLLDAVLYLLLFLVLCFFFLSAVWESLKTATKKNALNFKPAFFFYLQSLKMFFWIFSQINAISIHHMRKRTRLLPPKREYVSCLMCCQTT